MKFGPYSYLVFLKARRAFRTLQGIIQLQAVIRGRLVRRQAVATLYSVQGMVKFQALVRGNLVRSSDIGIEVQSKSNLQNKVSIHLTYMIFSSATIEKYGISVSNASYLHLIAANAHPNGSVERQVLNLLGKRKRERLCLLFCLF